MVGVFVGVMVRIEPPPLQAIGGIVAPPPVATIVGGTSVVRLGRDRNQMPAPPYVLGLVVVNIGEALMVNAPWFRYRSGSLSSCLPNLLRR